MHGRSRGRSEEGEELSLKSRESIWVPEEGTGGWIGRGQAWGSERRASLCSGNIRWHPLTLVLTPNKPKPASWASPCAPFPPTSARALASPQSYRARCQQAKLKEEAFYLLIQE